VHYITGCLLMDLLDEQWDQGVPSPWEGELGMFHAEDLEMIPECIRNRLTPSELKLYDLSHTTGTMTADFSMQLCDATIADSGDENEEEAAVASTGYHEDEEAVASTTADAAILQTRIEDRLTNLGGSAVRVIRKLSNNCLVEHLDVLFQKNEIVKWPHRLAAQ
jgi:hypothetical protein